MLAFGHAQPRLLDDLRNFVFDSFQRLSPRPYDPDAPVRVVAVDEASLAAFGQWPWPRTRLAELTGRLAGAGAAAVAFDCLFAEPDRSSLEFFVRELPEGPARQKIEAAAAGAIPNDRLFAGAIAAAPVVLGMTLSEEGAGPPPPPKAGVAIAGDDPAEFLIAFPSIVAPLPELAEAARGLGATNWQPDRDQTVRRVPLVAGGPSGVVPSLALEALRVAQGASTIVIRSSNASGEAAFGRRTGVNAVKVGEIEIATGASGDIRPRYAAAAPQRRVSAADVLTGRAPRAAIDGRIILIGVVAVGAGDIRATPLEPASAGVDIHAQLLESLLSGALLSRPDWAPGLELVAAALAYALVALALLVASPFVSASVAAGAVAAIFGGAFLAFERHGLLFDPAFPSLAAALAYSVGALTLWRFDQLQRRRVHNAFGKFVAPAVVDRLVEHPERLALGGETRELTVMFSDLRDFSGLSEGMSAQELTLFMNDYLTPMTDAILDSDGTIDKYVGDAIVAFWNAPLDVAGHPRKAALAVLEMRAALARLNAERAARAAAQGRTHRPAAMGVGVNLGLCSVGNMGSTRRFDYSILGDDVNLASRLEGLCKTFRTDILASGAVRRAAPDLAWLPLGTTIVAGRRAPTEIFALAGDASTADSAAFADWRDAHDAMMASYFRRAFAEARERAAALLARVEPQWRDLYGVLLERFAALEQAAPGDDWTPAWTSNRK
ncbi:adenylate/guanylate cyclase domain-containing protein [Methylosinus sp. Sm6]|nr:adenylate/guanylate cyclase domain-containing protein [Methylosinus sp. Sm6]